MQIQIYFNVAIKKMLVIQFPYMAIVWLAVFFDKSFSSLFGTIHWILCQNNEKDLEITMTPF